MKIRLIVSCLLLAIGWFAKTEALQSRRARQLAALAETFVGVTTDGTPNGNDYGKDLLRQHYEAHRHDPSHGHQQ